MSSKELVVPLTGGAPGVEVSPVNAIAIRETSLGQYLESINTGETWFARMQQSLGFEPQPLTALDALYITSGIAGAAILAVPFATGTVLSLPVLAAGAILTSVSAIGMSEQDRATKIGGGIAAGALVVFQPQTAAYVVKEAFGATTEVLKQTAQLATSGIGLTTAGLGLGFTLIAGEAVISKKKNHNKKRRREEE